MSTDDISTPANIGKISGYGWSLGYVGGLLAMGIAFMGPLFYGQMTTHFGSQRYGIGAIIVLFLVGTLILATVDEKAGVSASGRTS